MYLTRGKMDIISFRYQELFGQKLVQYFYVLRSAVHRKDSTDVKYQFVVKYIF